MSRVTVTYAGDRVGLFAIDGGGTTGVAYGTATLRGSTKEVFERDPLTVEEIDCWDVDTHGSRAHEKGCIEICALYQECVADWILKGIGYDHHFFIYEDFMLRGQVGSLDRRGILPLAINNWCMGFLADYKTNWVAQTPEQAKSRWNNDRLKRSGLWTRGKQHGRDATRHAALWVAKNL